MNSYIKKIIIHELEKEADSGDAQLYLSDQLVPIDSRSEELIITLNDTFVSKTDLLHGSLSTPEDALFPGYLQEVTENQFSEEAFIEFSQNTMRVLQEGLQGVIGAKGGYLVYAEYEHFETRMLGIFLIRDKEGIVFRKNKESNTFNLHSVKHLDTDRLAMACRITLNKFQQNSGRFVDLLKHAKSQKEISEYFVNWIGLDQPESSKSITQTFMNVVDKLPLPLDEDTGQPMEEEQFHHQVMAYAVQSPQKTVELDKFDQHFYGDEPIVQNYLKENHIELDNEIRVDKGTMKSHYTYRASAEGISVSFSKNDYTSGKVSIKGDNLVIDCPQLIEKIMDMLEDDGTW
ncbi:MAG: nucleoid-associated protein [Saprospiraceae bacterium]|jgi:nucleoid-associated protein